MLMENEKRHGKYIFNRFVIYRQTKAINETIGEDLSAQRLSLVTRTLG